MHTSSSATASTSTTTCATSPITTTPTPAHVAGSSATGSGARRQVARFAPMLAVGDPAPDVSLPDQNGAAFDAATLRGRRALVYFYPRADTPGCTTQACGLRDV